MPARAGIHDFGIPLHRVEEKDVDAGLCRHHGFWSVKVWLIAIRQG